MLLNLLLRVSLLDLMYLCCSAILQQLDLLHEVIHVFEVIEQMHLHYEVPSVCDWLIQAVEKVDLL